jgi:hypothetical protein
MEDGFAGLPPERQNWTPGTSPHARPLDVADTWVDDLLAEHRAEVTSQQTPCEVYVAYTVEQKTVTIRPVGSEVKGMMGIFERTEHQTELQNVVNILGVYTNPADIPPDTLTVVRTVDAHLAPVPEPTPFVCTQCRKADAAGGSSFCQACQDEQRQKMIRLNSEVTGDNNG